MAEMGQVPKIPKFMPQVLALLRKIFVSVNREAEDAPESTKDGM